MPRRQFRPVTDAHVLSVLHHVRSVIVREERAGLAHVDALLWQYGVDPETLPIVRKVPKHFKRGALRRAIMDALRAGPLTGPEVAAKVADGLPPPLARRRAYSALRDMRAAGLVMHDGRLWRLRPPAASNPSKPG